MTAQFDALRQQLGRYMSIEADRVRLSIRRFAVRLILGLAAAVIGLATLVTAAVLALSGLAGVIARAIGVGPAAGNLIVKCYHEDSEGG